MEDLWGIVANNSVGEKNIAGDHLNGNKRGGQCWLVWSNNGNGMDRNNMLCRSRGGRWIEKWINVRRLDNVRVKWIPPELRGRVQEHRTKEDAQIQATSLELGRVREIDNHVNPLARTR